MLLSPIMPSMPLMSHKRNFSRLGDDVNSEGIQLPATKRRCLNADEFKERFRENDDRRNHVRETYDNYAHFTPFQKASSLSEVQLSLLFNDGGPQLKVVSTLVPQTRGNCNQDKIDTGVCFKATGDHAKDQILQMDNPVRSEAYVTENLPHSIISTESNDTDSDCSEYGKTSIPKSKIIQPTISLIRVSQTKKKCPLLSTASNSTPQDSPDVFNVVQGGYVHRMANLNARACVSALLQSKKRHSKLPRRRKRAVGNSVAKVESRSTTLKDSTQVKIKSSETVASDLNCLEKAIPGLGVKFQANVVEIPIPVPSVAVHTDNLSKCDDDVSKVPYNKLGLLYNGDTIHPHTRVFFTQSVNRELQLPSNVVPTLVPSRLSTVKRLAIKAASSGVQHPDRKIAKRNNGWHPLGEPIKVITNHKQKLSKSSIKYYAGIKRKEEEIYVRDCVVIKAGSDDGDPYVAKVGSIWQEPDGSLMVTLFWYYKTSDAEVQSAGVKCVERELLASQHHDINSVASIEDKCYVLGYTQYCRYRASIIKSTTVKSSMWTCSDSVVRPRKPVKHTTGTVEFSDISLIEVGQRKQQVEDLSPSLSELQDVDPSLVFLCYRGFNHVSGKLQTGKTVLALKV